MRTAVFDSSLLVSACGWRAESYLCLVSMARRRVRVFTSAWIVEEVHRALRELQKSGRLPQHDPWPIFNWFSYTARHLIPVPTGKQRSRDPNDDPILGTALAGKVQFIVTNDQDLLVLEKPLGIEILRPRPFLARLQRPV